MASTAHISHAVQGYTHAGPRGDSFGTDQHGVGHIVPPKILIGTTLALLVLTVITVAVRYIDLGEANIWIALGIAVLKATLVALFFMHLWWDRPFNSIIFVGSIFFVGLMIGFTLTDTDAYQPEIIRAEPAKVQEKLQLLESEAAEN